MTTRTLGIGATMTAKLVGIGAMVLMLLVPLAAISILVFERESRQEDAIRAVARSWAGHQIVAGPMLVFSQSGFSDPAQHSDSKERVTLFPDRLEVRAEIAPEVRSVGIFEVPVYRTTLRLSGHFSRSRRDARPPATAALRSYLSLAVSDVHGIMGEPSITVDGSPVQAAPGSALGEETGIHVPLPADPFQDEQLSFAVELELRGTEAFSLYPAGELTTAHFESSWPHPSFVGGFLPQSHQIKDDGFQADWSISHLSRRLGGAPSGERRDGVSWGEDAFGVELHTSITPYRQTIRALKYGVLFVGFTFVAFFLFELIGGYRIHPIQYLTVGAALTVFYLLLLSISELTGFGPAYLAASAAVVGLITTYSRVFLAGTPPSLLLGGLLGFLYLFLYVLLRVEDYALLIGSIAVFLSLALFMYLTRGVNWYEVRRPEAGEG